jgi:A-macroglobulin TED domain/Alpha-2-macroglobulin family/Carboxypeptidase regulatory-like domain/MG2 domain/A-macroglobulin receptor binding domain/Alpha-2-macroglobulin bait region domain/Macroglobulin domain MG3
MRRRRTCLVLAAILYFSAASCATHAQTNTSPLRVEEEKMRFHLSPQSGLDFAIVNSSAQPISGNFAIELLNNEDDSVAASTFGTFIEKPGENIEKIDWPVKNLPTDTPSTLGWYRLRYSFLPDADSKALPILGIVQLGKIIPDGFGISLSAAKTVVPGTKYPARVHVENPATQKPYADTPVEITLEIGNDEDTAIKRKVRTDSSGNAVVTFKLPEKPADQEGEITADVARGSFSEEATLEFKFPDEPAPHLTLSTDKPLYQPGQTVHLRLFAIGPDKHAMANANVEVTIENQDDAEQFHEKLLTSRFGIASADWEIPGKIQLGTFTIDADFVASPNAYDPEARAEIRISRYELPTFTVSVDPDRVYYLPGQDAILDVHAGYLFGKPVQHGKVRIVRQENRRWDFAAQKWVSEDSNPVEGELDSDGHFKGTIHLSEDFKSFKETDNERFDDLTLAAYLTDSSTGRTEQRRFKIRITAQPIHLYVDDQQGASISSVGPSVLYITSSYADGAPATVDGKIFSALPTHDPKSETGFDLAHRRQIATFHTNRYGIGRVEIPPLPEDELRIPRWAVTQNYGYYGYRSEFQQEPTEKSGLLQLEAKDAKALEGNHAEEISVNTTRDFLRVHTDHTLYHPGDTIQVSIASSAVDQDAIVNVWNFKGLLSSRLTHLKHGSASVAVPFDPRFSGDIYITASCMTPAGESEQPLEDWTQVIFPAKQELDVKLKMARDVFRPGEEVPADLRVLTPGGLPAESALGILVYDRAVAERVRTDEDFDGGYGYSIYDYLDGNDCRSIGGVTYRDLLELDATRPFPDGLDLVAEGLVHNGYVPWMTADFLEGGGWDPMGASGTFAKWLEKYFKPARKSLDDWYNSSAEYPKDESEVRAALHASGIDFDTLRDPWGEKFRVKVSFGGPDSYLSLFSNGVDKQPNTRDDFEVASFHWPYFRKLGLQIDRTSLAYQSDTGKYIRDYATLREQMKQQGIDLDALRDPWGHPYKFQFDISGPYFRILITSAGKDGVFSTEEKHSLDDVTEWLCDIHYFANENADLGAALAQQFKSTATFPQNEEQLQPILAAAKLTPDRLLDPWGHPYHFAFSAQSRYSDSVSVRDYREYSDSTSPTRSVTEVTPVTQQVAFLNVLSDGPEKDLNLAFSVAQFSRVIAEQSSKQVAPVPTKKQNPLASGNGAIVGVVIDPTGAIVPNVTVTAIWLDTTQTFTTQTDFDGSYAFTYLPAGIYRIECNAPGFVATAVQGVPVQQGISTRVDLQLRVGAMTETVTVNEQAITSLQTSASTFGKLQVAPPITQEKPLFTPRLRKHFPETLVWRPEVITDKQGHAHIHFAMADNITAWKMSVLASTEDGHVGIAEKELRSFQPFFIEHDPPKVLTQGDQISLPVILRNYTDKPQIVLAEMQPESWFTAISAPRQTVTIAANGDASPVFTFRADHSARIAKQRVTARNSASGDAIERELAVHPDGQEISFSTSRVLAGAQNSLEIQIPENAIRGSTDAELRIYPNLLAHVLDAMKGIGGLPAGCGEQITSSGYVSLMALQLLKKSGQDKPVATNPPGALYAKALLTVQESYDQLVEAQNSDGGFRYWKETPSDVALTAYVLRFLNGARDFIEVDEGMVANARNFLVANQQKSVPWLSFWWDSQKGKEDANTTAYVARALAGAKRDANPQNAEKQKKANAALKSALDFLEARIDSWSDAYLAGNYAIAAILSGREDHIANAQSLLTTLAHREGDTTYWNLEANTTPFYGWGQPGRIETTALAVEALALLQEKHPDRDATVNISRGLEYLLTHKDRYAIWYSTQSTQNVIEALIAAIPPAAESDATSIATVLVNGHTLKSVSLPKPQDAVGPITIPLASAFEKGANKIEVVRSGSKAALNASVLTSYYIPWADSEAAAQENFKPGENRALHLKVSYDHTDPKMGDDVECAVQAERIGFRGYGMMLAEVGLPPGAEVDRASLEEAANGGGAFGYEIQPDKVVFYLWPRAGGVSFQFKFRMRYRMEAMSGPSLLYDYYNPESNAAVAPVRFTVH